MMTIIDPRRAGPGIPRPQLAAYASEFTVNVYGRRQRYPLEVWRVCNGRTFAIVTSVSANTSLVNASEAIARAIRQEWPEVDSIIEHWPSGHHSGELFVYSTETGASMPIDREELAAMGLVLPAPPPFGTG